MKIEEMNLERLYSIKDGDVFKNRRELCNFLEVEYKDKGKGARTQNGRIEFLFAYHKEGNKIIVDETYPEVIIELNFRLSSNRQKQISELLILDLILGSIDNQDEALIINHNVLIPYLALANKNYIYYYYNKNKELASKLGMKVNVEQTLESWLTSVRGTLKNAINSAIKQLEKEGYILHNKVYKVQTTEQRDNILKESKNADYDAEVNKMELATNTETNRILEIEKEILNKMQCTKKDLIVRGEYGKFTQRCYAETKRQIGIEFYFLCHKFNYAESFIKDKKQEIIDNLKNENINELKYELNNLMCEKVRRNSQKRVEKHNETMKHIDEEVKEIRKSVKGFGNISDAYVSNLMKTYESQLGKDYLNTKEHKDIEERLIDLLLVIKDINTDVEEVQYDTIIE